MSENAQAEPLKGSAGPSALASFQEEAADIWRRLPHKTLFAVLLGAWIALFHFYGNATMGYFATASLFDWAYRIYSGPGEDSHGSYIPFVVLLFLWIRRRELTVAKAGVWWPAIIYFGVAVLLHVASYRLQQGRISVLAFILGLHAMIGLVWGREAMRRSIFPVFLLLFCIPMGSIADLLTADLRLFVTKVSVWVNYQLLGVQVFQDGSQIFDIKGTPMYDVAPACSGMRSLIAMSALAVIYAFLNFDTPWKRAILIACALPMAVLGNIFRISTVILVGDAFGIKAGAMIEQKFGFVTFAVAIGGLMFVGWLLRERSASDKPPTDNTPPPSAPKLEAEAA